MNEREADVRAGFAHLRNLCDPRGHDLLRVFEELLIEEARSFRDVAAGLEDVKTELFVGALLDDNGHHSRRVDLWRADA